MLGRMFSYPTSILVLTLFYIVDNFSTYKSFPFFPIFPNIIAAMETKFIIYWEELSILLLLASIMNTRFNLEVHNIRVIVILIKLYFGSLVTHNNLEKTLCVIYKLYAEKVIRLTFPYSKGYFIITWETMIYGATIVFVYVINILVFLPLTMVRV